MRSARWLPAVTRMVWVGLLWAGLSLLPCPLPLFAQHPADRTGSVRVGVIFGFSGAASFWSQYQRMGIELAVEELRAQGKHIEIIWEDSQTTPVGAVNAFRKLADVDKVDVIVGDIFAFLTEPLVQMAVNTRVPLISPALTTQACERGAGWTFTVASQIPSSDQAFWTLFDHLGLRSAALVTFDDPTWGQQYRTVWKKVLTDLKIEIKEDIVLPEMVVDFKTILPRIVHKAPDAILFAHEPRSALKALRATGYRGDFISTNALFEIVASDSKDKALIEGLYVVDAVMTERFKRAFRNKHGNAAVLEAHASYEAIRAINRAAEISMSPFVEALRNVKLLGVAGDIDFSTPCRGRVGNWMPMRVKDGEALEIDLAG